MLEKHVPQNQKSSDATKSAIQNTESTRGIMDGCLWPGIGVIGVIILLLLIISGIQRCNAKKPAGKVAKESPEVLYLHTPTSRLITYGFNVESDQDVSFTIPGVEGVYNYHAGQGYQQFPAARVEHATQLIYKFWDPTNPTRGNVSFRVYPAGN